MKREEIQQGLIPNGYRQLEYLESTGAQYIKFDCQMQANKPYEIDILEFMLDLPISTFLNYYAYSSSDMVIFSKRDPDVTVQNQLYINFSTTISNNATSSGWGGWPNTKNRFILTNTSRDIWNYYEDGTLARELHLSRSCPLLSNITRFCLFSNYGNTLSHPLRIMNFRISSDHNDVINFYPALRIADAKPGFYDIVNDSFLVNQGTDEFLYA